jgi:cytochrome c oxidase subunit II
MISEDVIHSFFVPAFRVKQDVLPGYYSTTWFEATKPGTYHLFCAEYCGTQHSSMIGHIIVMEPDDYQHWLTGTDPGKSMVELGQDLFTGRGSCLTCHNSASGPRGPDLGGIFGKTVHLQNGKTVVADENYLRESVLRPAAKITAGYENLMPPYEGQISEEEVLHLVAYMKSLAPGQVPTPSPSTQPATAPAGVQP